MQALEQQLRVVSHSLFSSASTLVYAFIANRLDYCSSLYKGPPKVRLQPLNGVLLAAAHVILIHRHITEQWRNEGGAGEGGHPRAQPNEGAQKSEIWG